MAIAIYRVPLEVLVEAPDPEAAGRKVEDVLSALEASDLWYATEAGPAVLDRDATSEYARRGLPLAQRDLEDMQSFGVSP